MKRILSSLIIAAALLAGLASCNNEKPFSIHGRFDVPDSLHQHLAELDGELLYLIDIRGERLDSTEMLDGEFAFEGTVGEPYFAYVAGSYDVLSMIVIEPGDIRITLGLEENAVTGTPSNEGITRLEAAIARLRLEAMEQIEALGIYSDDAEPDETAQEAAMQVYMGLMARTYEVFDSTANAHPEDLVGVYAANALTSDAATPEALEEAIEGYSDYIRSSELFEVRLEYLRELNSGAGSFDFEDFEDYGEDSEPEE